MLRILRCKFWRSMIEEESLQIRSRWRFPSKQLLTWISWRYSSKKCSKCLWRSGKSSRMTSCHIFPSILTCWLFGGTARNVRPSALQEHITAQSVLGVFFVWTIIAPGSETVWDFTITSSFSTSSFTQLLVVPYQGSPWSKDATRSASESLRKTYTTRLWW